MSQKQPKRFIHIDGPDQARTLLDMVAENFPDSHRDIKRARTLIEFGAVYVNSARTINPEIFVNRQDVIRVHLEPRCYDVNKRELKKRIVQETSEFIVVNKPSGLPMHPTLDNLHENLSHQLGQKVFVTHRLDVPTSGLVLLAKTKQYQAVFNRVLVERRLKKIYKALVEKPIAEGRLRHFMKITERAPKELVLEVPKNEACRYEECLMDVVECVPHGKYFIVKMNLLTGRTHQIRTQLSFEGAPIVGDEMYGGTTSEVFGLHAAELSFSDPVSGREYSWVTEPDFLRP